VDEAEPGAFPDPATRSDEVGRSKSRSARIAPGGVCSNRFVRALTRAALFSASHQPGDTVVRVKLETVTLEAPGASTERPWSRRSPGARAKPCAPESGRRARRREWSAGPRGRTNKLTGRAQSDTVGKHRI
jgi:hypothetical protein